MVALRLCANSALFLQNKLGFRVSCRSGVSATSFKDVIVSKADSPMH